MKLRLLAIITMVVTGGAALVAQHGPEPKAHGEQAPPAKAADAKGAEAKSADDKAAEAKAAPARRSASASPLQTAAAIEQILRKLRDEGGTAPVRRASREAARPRLRLAWRLSLTWPDEVLLAKPAP